MSSTQHQLIEQCATRLRGIVEALDNIHDNTPHRWSTDLDEVHSSAESLLALIKDQAPARSEASFEEWLANELEGEDGQPVPAAVCDIALARRAFNHWPKLEQPAKVGGVRFSAGVSSRLVVEAAQRLYEFESTPEQEAERIERLQAFREQCFEPLGTEFSKVLSDNLPELLSTAQAEHAEAEAERPEAVGYLLAKGNGTLSILRAGPSDDPVMTVAQHERIVGALRFERQQMDRAFTACINERDAANARLHEIATACATAEQERDAAMARVASLESKLAELEKQDLVDVPGPDEIHQMAFEEGQPADDGDGYLFSAEEFDLFVQRLLDSCAAPVAQAQHSVPRAWLDVQAERRRQVEVEGYHGFRDSHYINYELSKAARAYIEVSWHALSGGLPCKKPESWPWMTGFKWADGRTMLVKAGALILAEIERLDRVAASQGGPSDA
ncbi:hypothetical protein I5E45_10430 [Pseudomonas aeruginosa]|uniref:hypothetical protein n=1 Tax=Pseudomonas aeruginosa TaxID=287 RepID=UPI0005382D57|nr:hypothetical protein [Pseudomonas aeruginosa]EKY1861008.1 hypothetical protein [Pseudomonas aeruginosa]MBG5552192.1 hypothetical protein [Pseudomonas aeruginosa]MBH3707089.1 hypothetical protein [Pseudomonas aeruginosa]MBH4373972.1 hypothetical protein [Pseudomonas aeruginosa]MBN5526740.1 hypothetical protein [Pseudomonas aeruginosa]